MARKVDYYLVCELTAAGLEPERLLRSEPAYRTNRHTPRHSAGNIVRRLNIYYRAAGRRFVAVKWTGEMPS